MQTNDALKEKASFVVSKKNLFVKVAVKSRL